MNDSEIFKNKRNVYVKLHKNIHTETSILHFITINTEKRRPILIDNITILRQAFTNSKQYFDYSIDAICVLPDHLHMIIYPKHEKDYPNIIKSIKTYFSKNINQTFNISQSQTKKKELGIWQRRYYEHTIINEKELEKYRNYIHYNPVKHHLTSNANEWGYSSFSKFVSRGYYDIDWYDLDLV